MRAAARRVATGAGAAARAGVERVRELCRPADLLLPPPRPQSSSADVQRAASQSRRGREAHRVCSRMAPRRIDSTFESESQLLHARERQSLKSARRRASHARRTESAWQLHLIEHCCAHRSRFTRRCVQLRITGFQSFDGDTTSAQKCSREHRLCTRARISRTPDVVCDA